jgi:tetratricopeptide (TPR) repeat protein
MTRWTVILTLACCLNAQNPLLEKGNDQFFNLEFEEALATFRQLAKADPNSIAAHSRAAHSLLYLHLYRTGALESELVTGTNSFLRRPSVNPSPEDQQAFHDEIAKALALADQRINANERDAQAWYLKGVALGLRANYSFLITKAWIDALRDFSQARKCHDRAVELQPGFLDARLVIGVHDYVVGSLPWHYRTLAFVVGFRGDKERGIATLKEVWEKGNSNSPDAGILLAAIYRRERRAPEAIPIVAELIRRYPRNHILRLEMGQMQSDAGNKEAALKAFNEVEQLRKDKAPGFANLNPEKVQFLRGTMYFWYRDFDLAYADFLPVTEHSATLDLNTATYAWMRRGQIDDLKGRRNEALASYRKVIAMAPDSDPGRESKTYMSHPFRMPRNTDLRE